MDFLVDPEFHEYPKALLDMSFTVPPNPRFVEPLAVITGVAGAVFMVIALSEDVALQSAVPVRTQYVPAVLAKIERVVSPVDQTYPPDAASEDVSTTPEPGHIFEIPRQAAY